MIKKIITIFAIMFLLISCYSHKIILNADKKSGKMIIEYNLNDDYFQLLSIAIENFANNDEEAIGIRIAEQVSNCTIIQPRFSGTTTPIDNQSPTTLILATGYKNPMQTYNQEPARKE